MNHLDIKKISFTNDLSSFDTGQLTGAIFIDPKAFDMVDYYLLLDKLSYWTESES